MGQVIFITHNGWRMNSTENQHGSSNELLLKIMPWEGFKKPNNKMDWKQLKEFCNSLDEKQLKRKVVLWRENEAINDIEAMALEADHYIGEDEEGCYTLADAGIDLKEAKNKGLKKVYEKGNPILWEEF